MVLIYGSNFRPLAYEMLLALDCYNFITWL